MLNRSDNELMCRVGPKTPMGNVLQAILAPHSLAV